MAAIAFVGLSASVDAAGAKDARHDGRYWVQSGAFQSAANANARCDLLRKRGYRFAVRSGPDRKGDTLFFCRSAQALPYEKAVALVKRLRLKAPSDAVLVLRRPGGASVAVAEQAAKQPPVDLAGFSGKWCGDPAVYGNDPLQIWTVKKSGTVTLQIAAHRSPDGQPEQLQGSIEKLSDNLIKLTGETAHSRLEAVYGIDASGLRGVSLRQETKDNGASMTAIPDSLHRCP
ncbi:MAG TPA: SPOR domain-containing protein [Stellaceae bacterium]|nr:SPOR domain-containing protein [Stellaceae bacterium]